MKEPKILNQPMLITAVYLLVLYGLAGWLKGGFGFWAVEWLRVVGVLGGFLLPHVLAYFFFAAKPRLSNVIITIVILLLLADVGTSVGVMFLLGLVTALVKTLVRLNRQPMVNPAATGLLIFSFFGVAATWWGVSFAPRLPFYSMSVAMLLTLPVGLFLIGLYKKLPTLVGVVVSFVVAYVLLAGKLPIKIVLEGTFAFFLLFMATEPKTTPVIDWQEWIYAVILGGVMALVFTQKWVSEPYLMSLVGLNLLFAGYKWIQMRMAG